MPFPLCRRDASNRSPYRTGDVALTYIFLGCWRNAHPSPHGYRLPAGTSCIPGNAGLCPYSASPRHGPHNHLPAVTHYKHYRPPEQGTFRAAICRTLPPASPSPATLYHAVLFSPFILLNRFLASATIFLPSSSTVAVRYAGHAGTGSLPLGLFAWRIRHLSLRILSCLNTVDFRELCVSPCLAAT